MIYTLTLNPCIDYVVGLKTLSPGCVNRTETEKIFAGGKGINVSIMLKNLGMESCALGFAGGFTGAKIEEMLRAYCKTDFVHVQGDSRINVKVKTDDNETEINGMGPKISKSDLDELIYRLDNATSEDIVVLSGNVPASLPDNVYEVICKGLFEKSICFVVDTTKQQLLNTLKYHPFLIKPNSIELREIFNKTIKSDDEIICYSRQLQQMGARNVLVSMAADGAMLLTEDGEIISAKPPFSERKAINSVGAGDSMVAGFLFGFLSSGGSYHDAFKLGIAAGSATAFSSWIASKDKVYEMLNEINYN